MSAIGRNDPCHCGSGKKYKKCCLENDAETSRAKAITVRDGATVPPARPTATQPRDENPAPPIESSPEMERWDAFFARFEKASLDERVSMALDAVRSESAFDGEWCFELLNELTDPLLTAQRDEDLRSVADEIVARHPSVAAEEPYVGYVRARLALRRGKDALPFVMEVASADAGAFCAVLLYSELLYAGQGAATEAALAHGRERLDEEDHVGILDGELETRLIIDRFVAASPEISGNDPELLAAVTKAVNVDGRDYLAEIVDHASGRVRGNWRDADFAQSGTKRGRSLRLVSHDWAFWMNARGVWPRSRVDLARDGLVRLLSDRIREAKKPTLATLLPEPAMLDDFVLSVESVHDIAAVVAAIPSWCEFLVERGFVTAERAETALGQLRKLLEGIGASIDEHHAGTPHLVDEMNAAWATPG